jgi:hypothetical protein
LDCRGLEAALSAENDCWLCLPNHSINFPKRPNFPTSHCHESEPVNLHPCHTCVGAQGKKTFVFMHRFNSWLCNSLGL